MRMVANAYQTGIGVGRSQRENVRWLERLAERGSVEEQLDWATAIPFIDSVGFISVSGL